MTGIRITDFSRQTILELIKAEQQKLGLSRQALEQKAGVPKDTLRDFERSKAYIPRADKLQKILNALGLEMSITRKLMPLVFFLLIAVTATPARASFWDKSKSDLGQATVEVAFSPDMGATDLVVKAIGEARKAIRVAAYSFTSKPIAQALLDAHKRGIDVEVVVDKSQAREKYSSAVFLADVGIPTRIDYRYAIMHSKFMIIDGANVETGSFNYTTAAETKNAENVMVIRNDPALARQYEADWEGLWNESEPFATRY